LKPEGAELARTDQEEDNRRALTPADPRPGGEPYYIDSTCPGCGTDLVLYDKQEEEDVPDEEIWHDEWTCPKEDCPKSKYVVLDAPEGFLKQILEPGLEDIEEGNTFTTEEMKERWQ